MGDFNDRNNQQSVRAVAVLLSDSHPRLCDRGYVKPDYVNICVLRKESTLWFVKLDHQCLNAKQSIFCLNSKHES